MSGWEMGEEGRKACIRTMSESVRHRNISERMPAPQRVLPGCGHVIKPEFAVIYVPLPGLLVSVIGTPQANVAHREKPIVGAARSNPSYS